MRNFSTSLGSVRRRCGPPRGSASDGSNTRSDKRSGVEFVTCTQGTLFGLHLPCAVLVDLRRAAAVLRRRQAGEEEQQQYSPAHLSLSLFPVFSQLCCLCGYRRKEESERRRSGARHRLSHTCFSSSFLEFNKGAASLSPPPLWALSACPWALRRRDSLGFSFCYCRDFSRMWLSVVQLVSREWRHGRVRRGRKRYC